MKKKIDISFLDHKAKAETISGWRVSPLSAERAAKHAAFACDMSKTLKEQWGDYKRPVTTEQTASTARLLSMTDDELVEYRNRTIDKEKARAEADAEKVFSTHKGGQAAVAVAEDLRHKPRNETGDAKDLIGSSATPEKRDKAVDSYMSTKAKLSNIEKAMINTANPEVFKPEKPKKTSRLKRALSLFGKNKPIQGKTGWE